MEVGLDLIFRKRAEGGDAALNAVDRKHLQRAFGFDARQCPLLQPCEESAASVRTGRFPSACPRAFWTSLEAEAGEAFWADLTRPDLGIPAVRALAPGLQPYPTDLVTPRLQREIAATGGGFGLTSGIALM
jgi:ribosomal protein S12 methylthiotransferase accessory factor